MDGRITDVNARAKEAEKPILERFESDEDTIRAISSRIEDVEAAIASYDDKIKQLNTELFRRSATGQTLENELAFQLFNKRTYAQSGEDSIIAYILAMKNIAFFESIIGIIVSGVHFLQRKKIL